MHISLPMKNFCTDAAFGCKPAGKGRKKCLAVKPYRSKGVCYLLGAGPLYDYTIEKRPQDLLIAADGGHAYAEQLGLAADILLGISIRWGISTRGGNCLVLPREKDDTDMLAAARVGLERAIAIFACWAGRAAAWIIRWPIFSCWLFAKAGRTGLADGRAECAHAAGRGRTAPGGGALRISQRARLWRCGAGGFLEGLKYPLRDAALTPDFPIGTSNELMGAPARIAVAQGSLLIIYPRWPQTV